MVVRSEPKLCPSKIMQTIKSVSARNFFKLYPQIKKKYFWGEKLWTASFFVETIGNANEEVVRKYVRNQLAKMDKIEQKSKQLNVFVLLFISRRSAFREENELLSHAIMPFSSIHSRI